METILVANQKAARASKTGDSIIADAKAFNVLARQLRSAMPDVLKDIQASLRVIATAVKEQAAANASSFSTRIPQTGRVSVRGLNATVRFGGPSALDAAAIENKGDGFVRHPIFIPKAKLPGPPGSWTSKNSHPAYLAPAFNARRQEVMELLTETLTKAIARSIGGRV